MKNNGRKKNNDRNNPYIASVVALIIFIVIVCELLGERYLNFLGYSMVGILALQYWAYERGKKIYHEIVRKHFKYEFQNWYCENHRESERKEGWKELFGPWN